MTRNSYAMDRGTAALLVPYLYTVQTRTSSTRDILANATTSWVPGIIFVLILTEATIGEAIAYYFLGYLSFVTIYEIGYLANDTIGLRNDSAPRDRLGRDVHARFHILFTGIRLAIFVGISLATGLLNDISYLVSYGALVAVILAHNLVEQVPLRFVTFLQMSAMRYFLPIYAALLILGSQSGAILVFCTGVFTFTLPRLLTYMEGKGRLDVPERSATDFHLKTALMTFPAITLLFALSHENALLFVWLWYCATGFGYFIMQRRGAPR